MDSSFSNEQEVKAEVRDRSTGPQDDRLELKQGVVLDSEGRPIVSETRINSGPRVRVFRSSSLVGSLLMGAGVTLLLVMGVTLISAVVAAFFVFWMIRSVLRLIGVLPEPPRDLRKRAFYFGGNVRRF